MKAILLAGGRGKRLRPITDDLPKALVPVAGKPILQWQIEWLRRYGVESFVLSIGHLAHRVQEAFGDGSDLGVNIEYVVEEEPLGTGGALRKAMSSIGSTDPVFVTNGDLLTDLDPRRAERSRTERGAIGAINLVPLPSPYGVVELDSASLVSSFREKPLLRDHWINAGVYTLAPEVFPYLPERGSLEHDVFPVLAREGKLLGYRYEGCFWHSIDSHKDIEEASEKILNTPP